MTKSQPPEHGETAINVLEPQDEVPPILPKGIVLNTTSIYAEVAAYDVLSPQQLKEYWRVYTTTQRRLIDPTARRLEAFWWHVWGSDRRELSGRTLAKIYEDISTGPTFVPLRGPPNRYEGPPTARIPQRSTEEKPRSNKGPGKNASVTKGRSTAEKQKQEKQQTERETPKTEKAEQTGKKESTGKAETPKKDTPVKPGPDQDPDRTDVEEAGSEDAEAEAQQAQMRAMAASSTVTTQAVPTTRPSILKGSKPRPEGPRPEGPRPTPRFALPSEDSEEEGQPSDSQSHGSGESRGTHEAHEAQGTQGTHGPRGSHGTHKKGKGTHVVPHEKIRPVKHDVRHVKTKPTRKKFVVASGSSSKRKGLKRVHSSGSHIQEYEEEKEQDDEHEDVHEDDQKDDKDDQKDDQHEHRVSQQQEYRDQHEEERKEPQHQEPKRQSPERQSPTKQMSAKAAGKQPMRAEGLPSVSRQGLGQAPWPTRTSHASPVLGSSITSTGRGGGGGGGGGGVSTSMRSDRQPMLVRQDSLHSLSPGSVTSTGSAMLEMPMVSRNRRPPSRPGHGNERPSASILRQYAWPLSEADHRPPGRGTSAVGFTGPIGGPSGPTTTLRTGMASGTRKVTAGTEILYGSPPVTDSRSGAAGRFGSLTSLANASAAPARLCRSMSQDSYGRHGQDEFSTGAGGQGLSAVMSSATIAAPSTVAVNAVFSEGDGPDTFAMYAKTGLEEADDDDETGTGTAIGSGSGSASVSAIATAATTTATTTTSASTVEPGSSSFNEPSPLRRQLYTPTRPAQTPRIPFARTRSQLNIILDREKERERQGGFSSWKR